MTLTCVWTFGHVTCTCFQSLLSFPARCIELTLQTCKRHDEFIIVFLTFEGIVGKMHLEGVVEGMLKVF